MKKKWMIMTAVLSAFFSLFYIGCKKTDQPFGVYALNGLDVPSPSPTPFSGAINVYVVDNGILTSGVTAILVDPNSNAVTSVTQPVVGFAGFAPSSLPVGTWTAKIPTQGKYYLSTQAFNVTGSGQVAVTFQAGAPTLSITPAGNEFYNYSNATTIAYTVQYNQVGNLNVPVSLSVSPALPAGWGVSFSPAIIGNTTNQSALTIIFPCAYQSPTFKVFGTRADASIVQTINHQIQRAFAINVQVSVVSAWAFCGNGRVAATFKLVSANDCGISWNFAGSNLMNGQTTSICMTNGATGSVSLSSSIGTISGMISVPSTGTVLNGNF